MATKEIQTADLSRNQKLVMRVLSKTSVPLSAYSILDSLRGDGIRAPLQIYRALDSLMKRGLVHRIESLNAFVACDHPQHSEAAVFAICDSCHSATELSDPKFVQRLSSWAKDYKFEIQQATVELRGRCNNCRKAC